MSVTTARMKDVDARIEYFTLDSGKNKVIAKGFVGKRSKPDFYYGFRDLEALNTYSNNWVNGIKANQLRKAEYKASRQFTKDAFKGINIGKVKLGDIFYTSWGYEQTNVEFYQVVELVSDKTVKVREVESQITCHSERMYSGRKIAVKDSFVDTEILTKRLDLSSERISISLDSYRSGWLWDGQEMYFSNDY